MADVLLDTQGQPTAPSSTQGLLYFDSTSKLLTFRNSTLTKTPGGVQNASVATQAYTTAEIYLAGSALAVPSHGLQVGATFRWRVVLTKTAGTGVLVWKIYKGTLGTLSDTAVVTFTQVSVPTSVTDAAFVNVEAVMRTVGGGTSAVMAGGLGLGHVLQNTGFSLLPWNVQQVTSGGFDSSTAGLIVGLSFNHGTAGAGNIEVVTAEMVNN